MEFHFSNCSQLLKLCKKHNLTIGEVMLQREVGLTNTDPKVAIEKMEQAYSIMENAVNTGLSNAAFSRKYSPYRNPALQVTSEQCTNAVLYALATCEVYASNGLIVQTPTAFSAGVLPAILISLQRQYSLSRKDILHAMFTATAIGYLIANNRNRLNLEFSKTDICTAGAMAAAAATQLMGGNLRQIVTASATAITQLLCIDSQNLQNTGLDYCKSKNIIAVNCALTSAQLALSNTGVGQHLDSVLATMQGLEPKKPRQRLETTA